MKTLNLALVIVFFTTLFVGCSKISELNGNEKRPLNAPAATLFSYSTKYLSDNMASSNVNTNIFRLIAQHWTETTYTDESNYDITTRQIAKQWWNYMYRDVLNNLKTCKKNANTESTNADELKTQLAMVDILEVYTYLSLVNTFGNVPYSEALVDDNLVPKYDDAHTILLDLGKRLQADITNMGTSSGSFASNDLIFGGNTANWKKFAGSLLLRIAVTISDADAANAKSFATVAESNLISSSSENAAFKYLSSSPNTNPIWVDLINSGRHDFIGCKTLIDQMNTYGDNVRLAKYFTDIDGVYVGGVPGKNSKFSSFSGPSEAVTNADAELLFIDYVEVEFLYAEAIERGLLGGSASTHYDNAIKASFEYWGATTADADTYLANSTNTYGASSWKEQIGTQKWIAMYNRGFIAWEDIRRLDFPKLPAPFSFKSGFPNRFTYPSTEGNLNATNMNAAAAAIGGNIVETKLYWDKF